jgi:apolipoprotein N-acyltransferase
MRSVLQLLGGFAIIAGLMAALAIAGYVMWWLALLAVAKLPMIGRRHRHKDWDRLNRS